MSDQVFENRRDRILNFIKEHHLGVMATVGGQSPEAAVVEYGETDQLELIVDIFSSSRKYKNLQQNPHVAFVIGWDDNITIQYEGETVEPKGTELQTLKELYFHKNPRARKWDGREGIVYLKVIPRWIRYSDVGKSPWEIFEITL